jgi:hypothetical protein
VTGADENDAGASEVLARGPRDPGRLAALSGSRAARLAAGGLLATAAVGWLVLGAGRGDRSVSPPPAVGSATPGEARAESAAPGTERRQTQDECVSDRADSARKTERTRRDVSIGSASTCSRELAGSLYRFARHPTPGTNLPWAQDVALTAPGAWVVVPRSRAAHRNAWTAVSGRTGEYLLADLAHSEGRYRTDDTRHVDCHSRPRTARTAAFGTSWISVQAHASVPCSAWWAVDVFLDERHRIARVTVTTR